MVSTLVYTMSVHVKLTLSSASERVRFLLLISGISQIPTISLTISDTLSAGKSSMAKGKHPSPRIFPVFLPQWLPLTH